jgi:hypothetical protein
MAIIIIKKRKLVVEEKPKLREPARELKPMDDIARPLIEAHPNLLVAWFLMASWAYYVHDVSIVSDAFYDEMCETLIAHWDDVEHPHKDLIDRDLLSAGSGFYITQENAPGMTRSAAAHLVKTQWGLTIRVD